MDALHLSLSSVMHSKRTLLVNFRHTLFFEQKGLTVLGPVGPWENVQPPANLGPGKELDPAPILHPSMVGRTAQDRRETLCLAIRARATFFPVRGASSNHVLDCRS